MIGYGYMYSTINHDAMHGICCVCYLKKVFIDGQTPQILHVVGFVCTID